GYSVEFLILFIVQLALLTLSLIDARTGLLPDALTLPLLWTGLLLALSGSWIDPAQALGGVMVGYVGLWLLLQLSRRLYGRDGMGRGDLKLLAAIGAWTGSQILLWVLLLACISGVVYAAAR